VSPVREWMRWGVWVFAVGGALWVLKVAFIALNDAGGRDIDSFPVPLFYLGAIFLMVAGSTAVGLALVPNSRFWVKLLAAAAAVVGFFVLYTALDGILKATFGDAGPSWLKDELGILATGAVCLVGGVLLAQRIARGSASRGRNVEKTKALRFAGPSE
jgi:hypothetical protein